MKIPTVVALTLLTVVPVANANLLTNGDFSAGNTGFSSQYSYAVSSTAASTFTVGTDPQLFHFSADSFGDHTTGTGRMLIANGAGEANRYVWQQSVTISANTTYIFSGWTTSWGNFGDSTDPSPSSLILLVDGIQVGTPASVLATNGQWSELQFSWQTGLNTNATLTILDTNTASTGNDFALDDLRLNAVPEPGTTLLLGAGLLAAIRRRRS